MLNHHLVAELLDAILLPADVSVCKCEAHTHSTDVVSQGNARADYAAKAAAQLPLSDHTFTYTQYLSLHTPTTVIALQSFSTVEDKRLWSRVGATITNREWWGPNGKPCLPSHFFPHFAKLSHGLDHVSKGGMMSMMEQHWFTKGFSIFAQKYCQACVICATHNVGRSTPVSAQAAHPPPTRPFEHLMMDFIELDPAEGKNTA